MAMLQSHGAAMGILPSRRHCFVLFKCRPTSTTNPRAAKVDRRSGAEGIGWHGEFVGGEKARADGHLPWIGKGRTWGMKLL